MRTAFERIVAGWAICGGILLLLIVTVTTVNVGAYAADAVARLFGGTVTVLSGYEDFVRLTTSAAAPMLLPYCQLRRGHVAVDIFIDRFPQVVGRVADAASMILMTALAVFLLFWMFQGMVENQADGAVSRVLGWSEWPFYLPGLISLILWAVVAGTDIRRSLAGEPPS